MAGNFYLDLREMGYLTYIVFIAVILLEMAATLKNNPVSIDYESAKMLYKRILNMEENKYE